MLRLKYSKANYRFPPLVDKSGCSPVDFFEGHAHDFEWRIERKASADTHPWKAFVNGREIASCVSLKAAETALVTRIRKTIANLKSMLEPED